MKLEELKALAAIDLNQMSVEQLSQWIEQAKKSYFEMVRQNPDVVNQLQPVMDRIEEAEQVLAFKQLEQPQVAQVEPIAQPMGQPVTAEVMPTQAQPYEPKHLKPYERPDSYMGPEYHDYYPVIGQSRDSDALERSNFKETLAALGGESEHVLVIRDSHWAVGWVETIYVLKADNEKVEIADRLRGNLENYPVVNEEAFSMAEWEEREQAFENGEKRDMEQMLQAGLGDEVFEFLKSKMDLEPLLLMVMMSMSGYHGETIGPRSIEEMRKHSDDLPLGPDSQLFMAALDGAPLDKLRGLADEFAAETNPDQMKFRDVAPEFTASDETGALPIVRLPLLGRAFYYDERLGEYRDVDDPHSVYSGEQMDRALDMAYEYMMREGDDTHVNDEELETTAEDETNWEAELYEAPETGKVDIADVTEKIGPWVAGDLEDMGYRIQQYAKQYGWEGEIVQNDGEDEEAYYEALDQAEKFMNKSVAPSNYYFGVDESGDWGLWEGKMSPEDVMMVGPDEKNEEGNEAEVVAGPEESVEEAEDAEHEPTEAELKAVESAELKKRYGGLVKYLMARKASKIKAATQPDTQTSPAPQGKAWVEEPAGSGNYVLKTVQEAVKASLDRMTIASEFCDDLYPRVNAEINVGDRVYIKPLRKFGEVIRVLEDGVYRVQASKSQVNTYFNQELEIRKTDK